MDEAEFVREVRAHAGLSVRALADAAGVAASTVHRIERGQLRPTVETLRLIAEAAGVRLAVEAKVDYAVSLVGLARSIRDDVVDGDSTTPVRKAAELARRFWSADPTARLRMIAARPPSTGDARWDAFLGALGEWLAVRAGLDVPSWVHGSDRYLGRGWWVTPMASMRAWEYAGSPASFQSHGVYLHRDSLTNVLPGTDRGTSRVVYDGDCLTVSAASPEYLLATKLLASRVSRDEDDILLLYRLCGLTSVDQGLDLIERYYPGRPIEAKVRFFLEELLGHEPDDGAG